VVEHPATEISQEASSKWEQIEHKFDGYCERTEQDLENAVDSSEA